MAERYRQLLKNDRQYQIDCPVMLAASALLLDTQTQRVLAQLKMQSIVSTSISAVCVVLECFDPAGSSVLCHEEFWFRDLTIQFAEQFGQKTAIPISNGAVRKFTVHIETVVFTDGHTWSAAEPRQIMLILPDREPLSALFDPELVELFAAECEKLSGRNSIVALKKQDHINYCACGAVYDSSEEKCPNCGVAFSAYERLSETPYLEEHLAEYREMQRVAVEKAAEHAEEMRRVNAEKEAREQRAIAERKKVASTRKKIGLVLLAFVIIIFVFISTVFIPALKYRKATDLMTNGEYSEAALIFNELGRYRNANELCVEAFIKAGNMKEAGILLAQADNFDGAHDVYDFSKCIAAGDYITLAVKNDGTVYSTPGFFSDEYAYFSGLENVVEVYCQDELPCAFGADGEVFETGGMGVCFDYDISSVYERSDTIYINTRRDHALAMTSSGEIFAVGENDKGQCNVSTWTDILAVDAGEGFSVGLNSDGTVVLAGNNHFNDCDVSSWKNIITIAASDYHIVGLRADGTVVATGYNEYGQCNVIDWTDIVAISAGRTHTIGLKTDGTVVAVGNNEYGQCNVSDWKLW